MSDEKYSEGYFFAAAESTTTSDEVRENRLARLSQHLQLARIRKRLDRHVHRHLCCLCELSLEAGRSADRHVEVLRTSSRNARR